MERDEAAGDDSIALALGPLRASLLVIALHVVVVLLAGARLGVIG